ncbi:hypothetical protein NL676_014148 [Syzygium grande]|nr:hypothetical protein NL676_014148 [Syzygium grande]
MDLEAGVLYSVLVAKQGFFDLVLRGKLVWLRILKTSRRFRTTLSSQSRLPTKKQNNAAKSILGLRWSVGHLLRARSACRRPSSRAIELRRSRHPPTTSGKPNRISPLKARGKGLLWRRALLSLSRELDVELAEEEEGAARSFRRDVASSSADRVVAIAIFDERRLPTVFVSA